MKKHLVTLLILSLGTSAWASLGLREGSIDDDLRAIAAVKKSVSRGTAFVVHELANDHLTVREYTSNGVVFAIAWQGMRHPDLTSLLGNFMDEYRSALHVRSNARRERSPIRVVQGNNVVVEKSGHLRWVQGRAYIPRLLPNGVRVDEIR